MEISKLKEYLTCKDNYIAKQNALINGLKDKIKNISMLMSKQILKEEEN